jgi:hypothetical protein
MAVGSPPIVVNVNESEDAHTAVGEGVGVVSGDPGVAVGACA